MASSYIDQIDAQLAHLRMEIERLQIARDVIAGMEGRPKPVLQLRAEPTEKKSGPITIRKMEGGPAKAAKKTKPTRRVPGMTVSELTDLVRAGMEELPPCKAVDIGKHIGLTNPEDVKRIWYVISTMINAGEAKKEDGLFSLTRAAPAPVNEAAE